MAPRGRDATFWVLIATLLVVQGALLRFCVTHWGCLYDDAYIYFRYVENIWSGCGPTFNCDDTAVEGFSSPLYLALLVLARAFTSRLETVAQVLDSLALGAALAVSLYGAWSARWFEARTAVATSLALLGCAFIDPYLLLNGVIGLDEPLLMLEIALLFWAALNEKWRLCVGLALLAAFTRPEGVLCILCLPIFEQLRTRRWLLGLGLALTFGFLLRLAVFGDVLPNTYFAKSGGTARHAELGLEYLGLLARDFPLILLSPLAYLLPRARRPALYIAALTLPWLLSFLRTGGDTFGYSRLAVPLVPTLSLLGAAGLVEASRRLCLRWRSANAIAAALGLSLGLALAARGFVQHPLASEHGFANVRAWKKVGQYLRDQLPGARVATVPVGAISYVSGLHVIDLVGLTSRTIAKSGTTVPPGRLSRNWVGHERHDALWVLIQKPDVIVTTKFRAKPWTLPEARAGFIADWELLQLIKAGQIPFRLHDAEITPGTHWLMFVREGFTPKPSK